MAEWQANQKFEMPMFNSWVPRGIRPVIYLAFALTFQLSGSVYWPALQHMMGRWGFTRPDVTMVLMMGVIGVGMTFPFLFRFKLRFTNRQLLLFHAGVILVCNLLSVFTQNFVLLCALSFIAGFCKLGGTFECFSNIRLWISPKQNFTVFLPTIYMVILASHSLSAHIGTLLCHHFDSWQAMNWFMTGLLALLMLTVYTCTHDCFLMPIRLPLVSLDWLGCLLWSAAMATVIFIFTYGEQYNWLDGRHIRYAILVLAVILYLAITRMLRIRHPFISPDVFCHWKLLPILGMFFVAEVMNATPKALTTVFTGGILHWGGMQTLPLNLVETAGSIAGCLFVIWWINRLKRPYTMLLTVGFTCLLFYQVMLYFLIMPTLPLQQLALPTFMRTFGYAIFFATLTLYLKQVIEFPAFFMALSMAALIRNGVAESICNGLYSYGLRRQIAETLSRAANTDMSAVLQTGLKEMFGIMCIVGTVVLMLMLLYHVDPVRKSMRSMPPMDTLATMVRSYIRKENKKHNQQR